MSRRIHVVGYDPLWPAIFEAEGAGVSLAFGENTVTAHHIGSTAVPGMPAKPTVDILLVVREGTDIEAHYPAMQELGYQCRGESLDAIIPGTPGRYYFPKLVGSEHVMHVHVCHEGHFQIEELLALRDYLRAHDGAAAAYGLRKAEIAATCDNDNVLYMRSKAPLVRELIARALAWRGGPPTA